MLPEIMRDEVFRLETPNAWLRWPQAADADQLGAIVAQACDPSAPRHLAILAPMRAMR